MTQHLTLRQAADRLGITRQAVAKAIATGRLAGVRQTLPTGQTIWLVEAAAVAQMRALRKKPASLFRKSNNVR